jgi:hypothetical protein
VIAKIIATAAVGGAVLLGSVGVAGAATGGGSGKPVNCANAPARLAKIASAESRIQTWLPKAQERLADAQKAGNSQRVAAIEARITKAQNVEAALQARQQRIQAACPGA